ncbi:MAG: ORF6N domain-containing protein [Bacteroidia bacterium]|nr:ORF6N domain-containing protein [Bacteroidia bacterium]
MNNAIQIPDEIILRKIYLIREKRVMIDRDLAGLFGVETKRLKEAVRRHLNRFPADFMFEMDVREMEQWRREHASDPHNRIGLRYAPYCFTEQGVTMLACVLNSDIAIEMNVRIIRVFTHMRELLLTHKDILIKLKELEDEVVNHSEEIKMIFEALKQLLSPSRREAKPIGFRVSEHSAREQQVAYRRSRKQGKKRPADRREVQEE